MTEMTSERRFQIVVSFVSKWNRIFRSVFSWFRPGEEAIKLTLTPRIHCRPND